MRLLVGNTYKSNNYGDFKIVGIYSDGRFIIRFVETGYTTIVERQILIRGKVKDKKRATVYGVGVIGDKYPCQVGGKRKLEYALWKGMLRRCYSPKEQAKNPTYEGCTVSENFKSYEYFYEWCQEQKGFGLPDWQLDKDLLVKGNKVYSEDTCCFLPRVLNSAIANKRSEVNKIPIGVRKDKNGKFFGYCRVEEGRPIVSIPYDTIDEALEFYRTIRKEYVRRMARSYKKELSDKAFKALMLYSP